MSPDVTEPPLRKFLTVERIVETIKTAATAVGNLVKSCHNQAAERLMKVVTKASGTVSGSERREQYILYEQRKPMPRFCFIKNGDNDTDGCSHWVVGRAELDLNHLFVVSSE